MFATAPPAVRFLLVEVPGPWGRVGPTDSRLDRYASGRLADVAERAGVRVLLVRRPGRHSQPPEDSPRAWALVDTRPGREATRWGRWRHEHELLEVDLAPSGARDAAPDAPGPSRLALVCTQGRHDLCCAVRGRPVALAVAARATGWDVWECSHVGGDRFAANLLVLPRGEMFGGLDPDTAVATLRRYDAGRLDLEHSRGRAGRPLVEQAALHHVAVATGEDGLGALHVVRARGEDPRWTVDVAVAGRRYRVRLEARWSEPAWLTCSV
ncbi:MAG TPA: sucrase ferredoxin, partial [Kineosporiaceae bacterium]|nr:sucrase ferredoxin [Kineosporiaceae bacterium]